MPTTTLDRLHGVEPSPATRPRGYLEMFDLFRIVACLAVLSQHSFIWTNMSGNFIGTGFITLLHLSRNSFFFLTGVVVTYAQVTHPRSLGAFWKRRFREIGIPYLAWTAIYLVFSLITVTMSWDEIGRFLRHNLFLGYSQLYFVVVIFQFYLAFPLLAKLMRSTRRHGLVMAASLCFATFYGLVEHYRTPILPVHQAMTSINSVVPMSRDILSYQEFLIAGMLVALHLDQVLEFVGRRYRQILMATVVAAALEVIWYTVSVGLGSTVERASDDYQPSSALWCFVAIAGVFALSWWWQQRTSGSPGMASSSHGALPGRPDRRRVLRPYPLHQHHPLHPRRDRAAGEPALGLDRGHPLGRGRERDLHLCRARPPNSPALGARWSGAVRAAPLLRHARARPGARSHEVASPP